MTGHRRPRSRQQEVEEFVNRLKDFYGSLDEIDRDMLEAILESSQGGPQRYVRRSGRYSDASAGWAGLARWLVEGDDLLGWFDVGEADDGYYFGRRQ